MLLIGLLLIPLLLIGAVLALLGTRAGNLWLLDRAGPYLPGELSTDHWQGNLLTGVTVEHLSYRQGEAAQTLAVSVHDLRLDLVIETTTRHMRQYLYALMSSNELPTFSLRPPTERQTIAARPLAETAYYDRAQQSYNVEDLASYNLHLLACSRRDLLDPGSLGLSAGQLTTNRRLRAMSTAYTAAGTTDVDPSLAFENTASP